MDGDPGLEAWRRTLAAVDLFDELPRGYVTNGAADSNSPSSTLSPSAHALDATAISALVGAAKPDPRMLGHALQLVGLQPGALEAGGIAMAVEPKCVRHTR